MAPVHRKKVAKVVKARNPNDATFRNVTALKARVTRLEDALAILTSRVDALDEAAQPTIPTETEPS